MGYGADRLLARTIALRSARATVVKFRRILSELARCYGFEDDEERLRLLREQSDQVLKQIDEALK